jgi:hypothetical protein
MPIEVPKMEVEIVCPFCGGTVQIGFEGAIHILPLCTTFEELDVEDYVHECHEFFMKTKKPEEQRS